MLYENDGILCSPSDNNIVLVQLLIALTKIMSESIRSKTNQLTRPTVIVVNKKSDILFKSCRMMCEEQKLETPIQQNDVEVE